MSNRRCFACGLPMLLTDGKHFTCPNLTLTPHDEAFHHDVAEALVELGAIVADDVNPVMHERAIIAARMKREQRKVRVGRRWVTGSGAL